MSDGLDVSGIGEVIAEIRAFDCDTRMGTIIFAERVRNLSERMTVRFADGIESDDVLRAFRMPPCVLNLQTVGTCVVVIHVSTSAKDVIRKIREK